MQLFVHPIAGKQRRHFNLHKRTPNQSKIFKWSAWLSWLCHTSHILLITPLPLERKQVVTEVWGFLVLQLVKRYIKKSCFHLNAATSNLTQLSIFMQQWNIIALRYFNPLGAHPSGKIGEDPIRAFTNLMPVIGEVALGKRTELVVLGGDYDTEDGTSQWEDGLQSDIACSTNHCWYAGVRDFIHVMDLATGHVAALERLEQNPRYKVWHSGVEVMTSVDSWSN